MLGFLKLVFLPCPCFRPIFLVELDLVTAVLIAMVLTRLLTSLLFVYVQAVPCSPDQLTYGLSQCDSSHTRSAVFYKQTQCDGQVPEPVSNLTCLLTCPAGSFLGFNPHNRSSVCEPCPANTYSNGGGERFSTLEHPWTELLTRFITYCYMSQAITWEFNTHCTGWSALSDGSMLVSGNTTSVAWVQSLLIYYANIVKDSGTLTVQYQKKSTSSLLGSNGLFSIFINEEAVIEDDDASNNHWKSVLIPLSKGINEIAFAYEKFSEEENDDHNAHIRFIEIKGTELSAHYCTQCEQGFSSPGSFSCNSCKENEYFEVGVCKKCPVRTYSGAGSSGAESCKQKKPCIAEDYREEYTSCVSDTRTKVSVWNSPHICDETLGVNLPDPETGLPCEVCEPGYHRHAIQASSLETTCVACPPGTATNSSLPDAPCSSCPAGSFASRQINYTTWSPLPDMMASECHPTIGQYCTESAGWTAGAVGLSSGTHLTSSVYLVLTVLVNVTDLQGGFEFSWSLYSAPQSLSRLIVSVDGNLVAGYSQSDFRSRSKSFPLRKGSHVIQFSYRHAETATDWCTIHWLFIEGTDKGGAPVCKICSPSYISSEGSETCSPCPAGFISDATHTTCESCPVNTYNPHPGATEGCSQCPDYSISNSNRTMCVGASNITNGHSVYLIENFTGIREGRDGYSNGLCSREEFTLFCQDSFYGPLHSQGSEFYLSVLNPGPLYLSSYHHYDSLRLGYAFALLNRSALKGAIRGPDEPCATDTSHMIVNLGTRIEAIQPGKSGFNITYSQGSVCSGTTYSSEIMFICDKREGDGYPELVGLERCLYRFQWRSRQACPLCASSEIREVKSTCVHGKRYVYVVEGSNCTLLGYSTDSSAWLEDCTQVSEVFDSYIALTLLAVLGVLFITTSVIFACFCKVKHRYQSLLNSSSTSKT